MMHRYEGYIRGRESLLGMAYFCLTVLESRVCKPKRKNVAADYSIDYEVLKKLEH